MIRLILTAVFLIAAVMIFTQFTDPTFAKIDAMRAEEERLDVALTKANELRAERAKLQSKYNLFTAEEKARLEKFLPETVDNVRLIIDIDRIAQGHGLRISNLSIGQSAGVTEGRAQATYGTVTLGFSVNTTYEIFLAFLADLERSLRLIDVTDTSFSAGDSVATAYTITIQTYWLPER